MPLRAASESSGLFYFEMATHYVDWFKLTVICPPLLPVCPAQLKTHLRSRHLLVRANPRRKSFDLVVTEVQPCQVGQQLEEIPRNPTERIPLQV